MRRIIICALVLAVLPVAVAHAQDAALDAVVARFQAVTNGWQGTLQNVARGTFATLALIHLAWTAIKSAMRNDGTLIADLTNAIFFIGIFTFLLETSSTLSPAIINSFRQAAGAAGGGPMSPGDVFAAGLNVVSTISDKVSILSPGSSVGLIICGLAVLACFCYIVATMILALVQSYFIVGAGVLFMAFGGSSFTSDIAVQVVRAVFATGAKLFGVILIAGIGVQFVQQWAAAFHDTTFRGVAIMIGQCLVLAVCTKSIPDMLERMFHGVGFANGGAIFGVAEDTASVATAAGSGARAVGSTATSVARWGTGGSFSRPSSGGGTLSSRFSTRM
jgi:type IV secretion system protein TrbL